MLNFMIFMNSEIKEIDLETLFSRIFKTISMSQMCYLCFEIWAKRDYLGSGVSTMSLSDPFSQYKVFFFQN